MKNSFTAFLGIIAFVAVIVASFTIYDQAKVLRHGERAAEEYSRVYVAQLINSFGEESFIFNQKPELEYEPNELIVEYKPGFGPQKLSPGLQQLHRQYKLKKSDSLFKGKDDIAAIKRKFPARTKRIPEETEIPDLSRFYVLTFEAVEDIPGLAKKYAEDPAVVSVTPNYIASVFFTPNDPFFSSRGSWGQFYDDLWGLKIIQADKAWDLTQGEGVVIAVVDTGVDYTHPDIKDNIWINPGEDLNANGTYDAEDIDGIDNDSNGFIDDIRGYDFTTTCINFVLGVGCLEFKERDNDPMDGYGHGTHVAGTIAATGNNSEGVIGVAPKAKVMIVQGLNERGRGKISDLAQSIRYAAKNGADVMNNSWGGFGEPPPAIRNAVDFAYGLGVVIVAAAGNNSDDVGDDSFGYWPACLDKVIVVSALTDQLDTPAIFTNFGENIDIGAPGGGSGGWSAYESGGSGYNILSLSVPNSFLENALPAHIVKPGYMRLAGTSMAAPHAAGVAALILARQPNSPNALVRVILQVSADDTGPAGFDIKSGYGRVNAHQAVLKADQALPELIVSNFQIFKKFVAPDSPVSVAITVENIGLWAAQDVVVEIFEGESVDSGTMLGEWLIPNIPPLSSETVQEIITILEPGSYTLHATADRPNYVQEISDLNNQSETSFHINIIPYQFIQKQVTDDAFPKIQHQPRLSGDDKIIWLEPASGDTADLHDIYLYNLENDSLRFISSRENSLAYGDISGDKIVWAERHSSSATCRHNCLNVYLYDLAKDEERLIIEDVEELREIENDRVLYEKFGTDPATRDDVYLYDISKDQIQAIAAAEYSEFSPALSGNRIVWVAQPLTVSDRGIYFRDLSEDEERKIASDTFSSILRHPDISGERIVWWEVGVGTNNARDAYLHDLSTDRTQLIQKDTAPALISEDRVYYQKQGSTYFYDLNIEKELRWILTPVNQNFDVLGDTIAWSVGDVFVATAHDFPSAPQNLQALPLNNQVELVWFAAGKEIGEISEYRIYRSLTPKSGYKKIATTVAPTYMDRAVTNGTAYYYRVTAVDNLDGESSFSNEAFVTPQIRGKSNVGNVCPSTAEPPCSEFTDPNEFDACFSACF